MTPEELKAIVRTWGGADKFARLLQVNTRTVNYWLSGRSRVSGPVAQLIRLLYSTPPQGD